jgi:cation:H+ antiporter
MISDLPIVALIALFTMAAAIVWVAGTHLSTATDMLSERWDLGEDLGGMIFLAIVTDLPEVAITASGALRNDLSIAIGNILGGIAMQTMVLVVLDASGSMSRSCPCILPGCSECHAALASCDRLTVLRNRAVPA